MPKVSVILPSRNEIFLEKTIDDLFKKCRGDFEILAVLDGYEPTPPIPERENLVFIRKPIAQGMRPAINDAAKIAKGEYLLKLDAHCMVEEGFDLTLAADCDKDWIVIPRRKSLDAENWAIAENGKSPVDYHYLTYPYLKPDEIGMHGQVWNDRARSRLDIPIDDEMSSQGSCWFMHKEYFWKFGGMDCVGYGDFVQEAQQIMNRCWLSGGRCVINKKTWYAHLHKGKKYGRGYYISKQKMINGAVYSADYWMNNRWPDRIHDLEWLIDKFWPVPTWPENWKEIQNRK
jgi:glycosyltransferase involved in cell wall biosynthesis